MQKLQQKRNVEKKTRVGSEGKKYKNKELK